MRIFVLEDEPLLAMLLEESLAELGHEVTGVAATVDQALAILESDSIDFALLDFSLGNDTNAVPVAQWLRDRRIPFLYLSGHLSLEMESDAPQAPLLSKPFSLEQLDQAIRGLKLAA